MSRHAFCDLLNMSAANASDSISKSGKNNYHFLQRSHCDCDPFPGTRADAALLAAAKKKKKNSKKKANGKATDAAEANGVKDQQVAGEEEEDDDDDEGPETAAVCANVD